MIKIGIIGMGRIGKRHATHIQKMANLSFVCDIDDEKIKDFNCPKFQKIEDIINSNIDSDLVAICTPNGLHAKHSIEMIKSGYNVLVEKPMALNHFDCLEMMNIAEKHNKRLFVVKQNRFNPAVMAIKDLLDKNKLGKIYSFHLNCIWNRNADYYQDSWKGTKDLDGGTLYTQFSHFLDLAIWFFGPILSCCGYSNYFDKKKNIEFEDTGVISFKTYNNIIGSMHYSVNSFNKNYEGSLTILGEKGTVKIGGQYINEIEYFNVENEKQPDYDKSGKPNDYGIYKGSMSNHDKVYKNIIEVFESDGKILTNSVDGLLTIQSIEKIYEQIRTKN